MHVRNVRTHVRAYVGTHAHTYVCAHVACSSALVRTFVSTHVRMRLCVYMARLMCSLGSEVVHSEMCAVSGCIRTRELVHCLRPHCPA